MKDVFRAVTDQYYGRWEILLEFLLFSPTVEVIWVDKKCIERLVYYVKMRLKPPKKKSVVLC